MNKRCGLVVPKDFVIADKIGADAEYEVAEYNNLPANKMTVDI
jgi:3-phosphoglycerate kinase